MNNKYVVLVTVTIGTMLSAYISSSVNIALSNIMQVFGFTMDSVVWVSLSYMLPYGSILPITGRLGDQFGRKRIYLYGLALFTVASLFVGLSWNSASLLFFRVMQGVGAGLLFPNSMAIVSQAFPAQERGAALGLWGALAAGGSALGPTVGGLIVESLDWRIIFYSILPISLLGLFLGVKVLTESKAEDQAKARIDYLGGILLVGSLICFLLVLNQGSKEGWTSLYILSLSAVSFMSMLAFLLVESHIDKPIVDLSLFRNVTFTVSNLVGFLSFMSMYGGLFLLPFYLRNIQGFTSIKAGIAILPLTLSLVLLAPLGGRMASKYGSRLPASLGMGITTCALFSFRLLDERTSYFQMAVGLVIMGIGLAFTMSPLSNGVMGTLPKDKLGAGSGVFNLFKNVGGSVGVAVMGSLLDTRQLVHADSYKLYLTSGSQAVSQTLSTLQNSFVHQGYDLTAAKVLALNSLNGMVTKRASIAAFDDVFLVTALLCGLGILPALFIRDSKKDRNVLQTEKSPEPSSTAVSSA